MTQQRKFFKDSIRIKHLKLTFGSPIFIILFKIYPTDVLKLFSNYYPQLLFSFFLQLQTYFTKKTLIKLKLLLLLHLLLHLHARFSSTWLDLFVCLLTLLSKDSLDATLLGSSTAATLAPAKKNENKETTRLRYRFTFVAHLLLVVS